MPNATFDDIVASANAQIASLQASEHALNAEINSIRDIGFKRPLTLEEREKLVALREAKLSVLSAIEKISLVTVDKLDQTDEVKAMLNAINASRLMLQTELDSIKHAAAVATSIANALTGIASLAAKLTALLA